MDKAKVPSGSSLSLESVFDKLQDKVFGNITKRWKSVIGSFGTVVDINNTQATSTELQVSLNTDVDHPVRLSIAAGKCLFPNGEYTETALSSFDLVNSGASKYYLIKIKYDNPGSDPVSTMNAFNFKKASDANDGSALRYSTFSDSYKIINVETSALNISSLISGNGDEVALAIVKTNASGILETGWSLDGTSSVSGVIDLRSSYAYKINKKLLNDTEVVFKDRDSVGTNKINAAVQANEFKTDKLSFVTSNTFIQDSANKTSITGIKPIEFLDPITSGVNCSINASGNISTFTNVTITDTLTCLGDIQLTGVEMNDNVRNFRIAQIFGSRMLYYDNVISSGIMSADGALGRRDHQLNVLLKWNYDDLIGSGASNSTFTFTHAYWTFAENALAGSYLYVPVGDNLKITGNTATSSGQTVLTVTNIDGSSWNGAGKNTSESNPAWIHSNASEYIITAIPVDNGTPKIFGAKQFTVHNIEGPTLCEAIIPLDTMVKYIFKIYGVTGLKKTSVLKMVDTGFAGAPDTDGAYLVSHPNINADGVLNLNSTLNGFSASIQGWSLAEEFEISYTTDESASFPTKTSEASNCVVSVIPSSTRMIDITTSSSRKYNVIVRPRIGGQQVSPTLSGTVYSGSKGVGPSDIIIADTGDVSLMSYKAVLGSTPAGGGNYFNIGLSSLVCASDNDVALTSVPQSLIGCVLTNETGTESFKIMDIIGAIGTNATSTLLVKNFGNGAIGLTSGGTVYINSITERARNILSTYVSIDYELTYIDADCDVFMGEANSKTVIRICQYADRTSADYAEISASETATQQAGNYIIRAKNGALKIDLFDPSVDAQTLQPTVAATKNNRTSFSGRIRVYGRPINYNSKNNNDII